MNVLNERRKKLDEYLTDFDVVVKMLNKYDAKALEEIPKDLPTDYRRDWLKTSHYCAIRANLIRFITNIGDNLNKHNETMHNMIEKVNHG